MPYLDIRTLFLCTGLTALLMGSIIFGVLKFSENNSNNNDKSALNHTFLACFSLFGGFTLNSFLISTNEWITSGIGTPLWLLGVTLFVSATLKIKKFTQISIKPFFYLWGIYTISLWISIYSHVPFEYRAFITSIYIAGMFLFSSYVIIKKEKIINKSTRFSYWLIFLGMIIDSSSLILRSLDIVLNHKTNIPYTSLLEATSLQAILSVIAFLALQAITFGFLLLFWQKAELDLLETASLDPLTSILNRRAIDKVLNNYDKAYFKHQHTGDTGISCVLLDLDLFKNINDQYGHIVGDSVLKIFSNHVKSMIDEHDYLGRFGGEEFIIIFINKTNEEVLNITNNIVTGFAKLPILINSQPKFFTVSAGISIYPKHYKYKGWQHIIREADVALYYSKSQGRNQTTVYNKSIEK